MTNTQVAAVEAWLKKRSVENLERLAQELDISGGVSYVDTYCALYTNDLDVSDETTEQLIEPSVR